MSYIDIFKTFDSPIKYNGLTFYPVKLIDFYFLSALSTCLTLEKNSIRDPILAMKAIQMTYLEYLFSVANAENELLGMLGGLLKLTLGKKDDDSFQIVWVKENGKPILIINDKKYDSSDFDEIKKIIAEQNLIELPDEKISKDVRDKMEEARAWKQKHSSDQKLATFEEQVVALSLYTGWTVEQISEMSVRKFFLSLKRANHMIMSNIYLTAALSGFVTFKDKDVQRTWLAGLEEEDPYADVKSDPKILHDKASFEEAMKK